MLLTTLLSKPGINKATTADKLYVTGKMCTFAPIFFFLRLEAHHISASLNDVNNFNDILRSPKSYRNVKLNHKVIIDLHEHNKQIGKHPFDTNSNKAIFGRSSIN